MISNKEVELRNAIYSNPSFKKLTVAQREEQVDLNVFLSKLDPTELFNFARKHLIHSLSQEGHDLDSLTQKVNVDKNKVSLIHDNSQEYLGIVFQSATKQSPKRSAK